ncbi:MAG: hypothetical protein SF053_21255 [Bacteroidia bacterium]|nr:hypothetical protein [Bacteroidia bacterium]
MNKISACSYLRYLLLVGGMLTCMQTRAIQVTFGTDTQYVCLLEPITLSPDISGQSGPVSYAWSTGDTTPVTDIMFGSAGSAWYWVQVTDASGQVDIDSIWISALGACVWPGDANGDGIANNLDLLTWGLAYGAQGMVRPNAHLNWIAQPVQPWTQQLGGGLNYAHADVNGDGLINTPDIQGIIHNYAVPNTAPTLPPGPGTTPIMWIEFDSQIYQPGDTIYGTVMLGTPDVPATDIHGVAFSVEYDPILIPPGNIRLAASDSWLGQPGQDLQSLDKDFGPWARLDAAITRIDPQNRTGYGRIADITVMIDDITGKNQGIQMVNVQLSHIHLTDAAGQPVRVQQGSSSFMLTLSRTDVLPGGANVSATAGADDTINLRWEGLPDGLEHVYLTDMQGRICWAGTYETPAGQTTISHRLVPGLYMLQAVSGPYMSARKLLIR